MAQKIIVSEKKNGKVVSIVSYNELVFRAESVLEKTNNKTVLAVGKSVIEVREAYDKEISSL